MSQRIRKTKKTYIWLAITVLLLLVAWLVQDETRSSRRQARYFSRFAGEITFRLAEGESPVRLSAPSGPYDLRLGYASIPTFSKRLPGNDFFVARQARPSRRMKQLNEWGLPPIYREKVQAGLKIVDKSDQPIFAPLVIDFLESSPHSFQGTRLQTVPLPARSPWPCLSCSLLPSCHSCPPTT